MLSTRVTAADGNALRPVEAALSGGAQVEQLKAEPAAVQHAWGKSQQPIAAAATATLELQSTQPNNHATTQRCTKRWLAWHWSMNVMLMSLVNISLSYKRATKQ